MTPGRIFGTRQVARLNDALAWGLGLERFEPNAPVKELDSSVR